MASAWSGDEDGLLDSESFRGAVVEHGRAVYRFLVSRLGPDAAEDAMAETFATAWKARTRFVDPSNNGLEAWLISIATVIVAAQRRQEGRWLQMKLDAAREAVEATEVSDRDDEDRAVARVDAEGLMRRARLAEAVVDMPRREREPLLLHVLDDRPYSEIARILDLPIGTVRSRISRGRQRLAAHLERARERG